MSAITRASEERPGLTKGDAVVAIVKATDVLLGKDEFVTARITDGASAATIPCFQPRCEVLTVSDATITRLYDALNRHDGAAAAACYTDDAVFEDPAFGRLTGGAVKNMWRMLCERSHDLEVTLLDHGAEAATGWARWSAAYTFTDTGRSVVNDIRARFEFRDDLIAGQVDSFDLRRWGGQALGRRGAVLGTTPLLGYVVRKKARGSLDAYRG